MSASREQLATVTLDMPTLTKDRLERLARETGRSQTALAVEAIDWYLEVETSRIVEIQAAIQRADAGEYASEEDVTAVREKFRQMGITIA